MKTIMVQIKDHSDRIDMVKALQDNGYDAKVVTVTRHTPAKTMVLFNVDDYEVFETVIM